VPACQPAGINQKGFIQGHFSWREGFGGFSYSKPQVHQVIDYIKELEIHHRRKSFLGEYHEFLEKFEVPYVARYIFKPVGYSEGVLIVPLGTGYGQGVHLYGRGSVPDGTENTDQRFNMLPKFNP